MADDIADPWADSATGFSALGGTYFIELLPDGRASVDHCLSGQVTLIDPDAGEVRSGPGVPRDLIVEIVRRWG